MPTKTDYVVQEISRRILSGAYQANQRLRQNDIAKELNVGLTPVREALLQLASEGYVDKIPYKGVLVAEMSIDLIHEIYELRRLLEGYATHEACINMTAADMAALRGYLQKMDEAYRNNDVYSYQQYNQSFHMTIYGLANNCLLVDTIKTQWKRFPRDTFHLMPHRYQKSHEQHDAIVLAFERRDSVYAKALMIHHISEAEYDIIDLVRTDKVSTSKDLNK